MKTLKNYISKGDINVHWVWVWFTYKEYYDNVVVNTVASS